MESRHDDGRRFGATAALRTRTRGRALLGVAVGALVLAACVPLRPPPPPFVSQSCAPSVPSSPADYQAAFAQVRQVGTEWISADGGTPVSLPDGRVVWLYGDTFTGRLQSNGALAPGWQLPHNSLIVQNGACFRPLMGGSAGARTATIPAPAGEWYWPASGVVEPSSPSGSGNVLRVFVFHEQSSGGAPPFNFSFIDMRIATFTLPDLTFVGVQPLPSPVPGDSTYYWGQGTLVVGSTLYVYGRGTNASDTSPTAGRDHRVARVPLGLLTTGPWEFYNGGTSGTDADWRTDPTAAGLMSFAADTPALPAGAPSPKPYDSMHVVARPGGGYLVAAKLGEVVPGIFGQEISAWTAPTPRGPWHYAGPIGSTPSRPTSSRMARCSR